MQSEDKNQSNTNLSLERDANVNPKSNLSKLFVE